ncbi:MAG: tetratricopeptide repeat protein [Spirochaetaceae bacterium]|nr:tetratricopeptide repeat protein [Spirochaetaceae bacterium]
MADSDASHPLARIAYISLPEDFNYEFAEFRVDPAVALPIELEPEVTSVSPEDLTWDASIAAMLKVLAYHPHHDDAAYFRRFIRAAKPTVAAELTEAGIIKAHNGDFAIAEELFLALTGLNPDDTSAGLNLAFAYEQHAQAVERANTEEAAENADTADGLRRSAERAYFRVLDLDPLHAETHINLAHFYLGQRRYADARPHLEVYVRHGKDDEQRADAQRILRQMSSDGLADDSFRAAYELIRGGSEAEGLRKIERFLDLHPDVWQAHFLRGWGLRRSGAFAEARLAFESVLAQGREADAAGLADTHNELAICNLELRCYDDAERNLRSALQLDPENTKIISNMGILAMKQGRLDDARRYFATIRELDPNDPLAPRYLHQLGA